MLTDHVLEQSVLAFTVVLFFCMFGACFITLHTHKCRYIYMYVSHLDHLAIKQ